MMAQGAGRAAIINAFMKKIGRIVDSTGASSSYRV
jgi:hypothetical protein